MKVYNYCNEGNKYFNAGKLNEAIAEYNKAIDDDPKYAQAYYNRGRAKYQLGMPKEAVEDLDEAVELKDDFIAAYLMRGNINNELGRIGEAVDDFSSVINLKHDHAQAYFKRAVARQEMEEYEKALTDYDQTLRYKRDHSDAFLNRAFIKEILNRPQEALDDYTQAINFKRDHPIAFYRRGKLLLKLKSKNEAIEDFNRAIELNLDNNAVYFHRGAALVQAGLKEEGIADLEKFLTLAGNSRSPFVGKAKTFIEKNKDKKGNEKRSAKKRDIRQEAILFMDVKDSTGILDKYGPLIYLDQLEKMEEFFLHNANKNGMLFKKGLGDGFMAVFKERMEAVKTAILTMNDLDAYNKSEKEMLKKINVGIGIDYGETIIRTDNDRFSEHVVVASRLLSLPGNSHKIFITANVYNSIKDDPDMDFEKKGFATIKGFRTAKYLIYSVNWE